MYQSCNLRIIVVRDLSSLTRSRGQAVLGRQLGATTPWLTERNGDQMEHAGGQFQRGVGPG